jgi:class 3 adenylate cyclase/predicted ATPase
MVYERSARRDITLALPATSTSATNRVETAQNLLSQRLPSSPIDGAVSPSASLDIGSWLQTLGLSQYEHAFRENAIDADVLPELTDGDLEKIEIPLGHRKRLLRAIARLDGAKGAAPSAPAGPIATSGGERRHVAVMFCDLVGSTAIASQLDAEDWCDLLTTYLDAAIKAIADNGGHVARKLGDGLMALFGYPIARENYCERAARAALAIQPALTALNSLHAGTGRPELVARIGIASGLVVVDASGEVYGDAPNVAARLQALAEPGSVLATADVQRQIAGLFVAEDRGEHELKGVATPVTLYRLVRRSGAARRLGARTLTKFVGRDEEMSSLARRWAKARRGEGQLLTIFGDPGLGKSRLVEEFRSSLGETPHTWVEWSASQLLQNTPLHPVVEWARQRFGPSEPDLRRLADLEATLKLVGLDPAKNLPLLAPLIDIPLPPEMAEHGLSADEFRRRQLAAMIAWVTAGARSQPIVLVCEDLHWADPTTLELIGGLGERGAEAALFVLATARPQFRPPWSMRAHHGALALAPLDGLDVRRMVGDIAARHALLHDTVERVTARAGGVPLFVEELTRLILERRDAGVETIPPTLQQSLAARLDQLGPAREVAHVAAVLGRDFSYAVLRAVAGLEDGPLCEALKRMIAADLAHVHGQPPEADYRFKHALIRDAAYESLLKSRRQSLHHRVAKTLCDRFPARAQAEPEMVAHHFMQAGLAEPASDWWRLAGEQAVRRSAIAEAVSHFEKAIQLADTLPDAPERRLGRLRLQIAYGNTLIAARGYGASETAAAYARASQLIAGIDDCAERLSVRFGLCAGSVVRGELKQGREMAAAFLRDVADRPDSGEAGIAHEVYGIACCFSGEFKEARERLERALTIYEPARDGSLAFRFAMDPGVAAQVFLAFTLWPLGLIERSERHADQALERARESGHANTLAVALATCLIMDMSRGRHDVAAPNWQALMDLSEKNDMRLYQAYGVFFRGWAQQRVGEREAGIAEMRRAIALLRAQGGGLNLPFLDTLLAEAQGDIGEVERALEGLNETIAEIERGGQHWSEAELYRVCSSLLMKRDPPDIPAAETALRRALEIARAQQARSFELRAAIGMARMLRKQGKHDEARNLLAPVYCWFDEGADTPDFREAAALLA